MKVLFVNHKEQSCGVYQFGKRVYQLASKAKNVKCYCCEITTPQEFETALGDVNPDIIIYNFYTCTMGWLDDSIIIGLRPYCKQYGIFHDGGNIKRCLDKYIFSGAADVVDTTVDIPEIVLDIPQDKRILLPRPLFDCSCEETINKVPTIGSFGFGFGHKGFSELVALVNETFDEAIINLHMTVAAFGDAEGTTQELVKSDCERENVNSNITLNITTDFISDEDVLKFLAKNDINVFLYGAIHPGISSVIDYALSVKKPLAISACTMFRHIINEDIVVSDTNTISDIINKGIKPLEKYHNEWSTDNFIKAFEDMCYAN